jgi:excisionase family DNA binding protein
MDSTPTSQRLAWGLGEVAKHTGLSLAFLRAEVRAGRLAARKFGRRVLVPDEILQRYLAEGSPGNNSSEHKAATSEACNAPD